MERTFQYKGSTIFYKMLGEGQPVILIHGFAETGDVWHEQAAFLQSYCRLIIPDLPGSGRSQILQQQNVTIADYAHCIAALLKQENINHCILLGHSMGGYIALVFAEMYPGELSAFGFVHSTAFADSEDKKMTRKKGIKLIEEYGAYPFIKTSTPNLFSGNFKKQQPEKVSALIEQGNDFTQAALIQYYTTMMNRPDRTKVFSQSTVPVLFIIGSEDAAAPLRDLLQQVHLPKVAYVHVLQGAGHMGMWEEPELVNNYILAFIRDIAIHY